MPPQFAVMGNPIAHTVSPLIHHYFARQMGIALTYEKILVAERDFANRVSDFFNHGGRGLNITLPFKQRAYELALVRTPRCEQAGAANTLWMADNKLHADNTDGIGLVRDLARYLDLVNQRVLVLGAGGAVRGIIAPLLDASIASLTVFNRTVEKAQALQADFPDIFYCRSLSRKDHYDLIINATSVEFNQIAWTWDLACSLSSTFCYDLSYALHHVTPFVQWAHSHGCLAVDGLGMLVEQAAEAFLIWHGVLPQTSPVLELLRK